MGWNGGASGSGYTGLVYGLSGSNSNYSGDFTGVNGGAGGLVPTNGVTAVGVSFGGGLLTGATGGVTATNYTDPLQFDANLSATILTQNTLDYFLFLAKQVCK